MKKLLPDIFKYLKHCHYECDYDKENDIIHGWWFMIDQEGLSFSVDACPDMISILSQRLFKRFGRFTVFESYYFYERDKELYFGDEAVGAFMSDITEKGMNDIFQDFRLMNSNQNLYTPSFQGQKDPRMMIKVMLSDRWKEEDAIRCQKFFEDKGCRVLIIWDYELKEDNRKQLTEKIKSFHMEDIPISKEFLATA